MLFKVIPKLSGLIPVKYPRVPVLKHINGFFDNFDDLRNVPSPPIEKTIHALSISLITLIFSSLHNLINLSFVLSDFSLFYHMKHKYP